MNKHDALTILQHHQGHLNGITAEQLARELSVEKRQVRLLVTELRMDGVAVCGHPKSGYFIAINGEEIEDTCAFLRSRAMHSLMLESRLRKLTLGELLGQMRLKT